MKPCSGAFLTQCFFQSLMMTFEYFMNFKVKFQKLVYLLHRTLEKQQFSNRTSNRET